MSDRGDDHERKTREKLEADGWWTCRAAGSLGKADVVALRATTAFRAGALRPSESPAKAILVECKATSRPYESFGPQDRARLLSAARTAGADAWLAWRAKYARQTTWIHSSEWPKTEASEAFESVRAVVNSKTQR